MKKITKTLLIMLAAAMAVPTAVNAQDPYDDLYYSPAKAEKKKKAEEERIAKLRAQTLPAADTYTSGSDKPLNVDVDTYNRRVAPSKKASSASQSSNDGFTYTRRLERYHDPKIVSGSGDSELMDYYYNTPSEQDINIYVINNIDPWDYGWGATMWTPYTPVSYWSPAWRFSVGLNPWFDFAFCDPWWGPSWNWGWGPSWSWGWGPSWAWGPSWGWGHGWGPGWGAPLPPPGHNHWASNSPGASRPHRPVSGIGNNGASGNRYNGQGASSSRPGNMGRPGNLGSASSGSSSRPGYNGSSGSYRPQLGGNGSSALGQYNNAQRGNSSRYRNSNSSNRSNSYNSSNRYNSNSSNRNSYNNSNTNNYNRSTGNYNSGSYNRSSGSYNSGSSRSSGGGYHGGGSGRGRR